MDDSIAVIIFFVIAVVGNIFSSIKKRKKKQQNTSKNIFEVIQEKISDKPEYSKKSEYDFNSGYEKSSNQNLNTTPPPIKKNISANQIKKPSVNKPTQKSKDITQKPKKVSKLKLKKAVIWAEILKKPVSFKS
jgi:hypothetical protein